MIALLHTIKGGHFAKSVAAGGVRLHNGKDYGSEINPLYFRVTNFVIRCSVQMYFGVLILIYSLLFTIYIFPL